MSINLVFRRLAGVGLAIAAWGCGRPVDAPASPDFSVKVCIIAGIGSDPTCQPPDCGGNSPVVNGFPINGFSKEGLGACNPAGVQMLPRSLQGGGCGSGADLSLAADGKKLVGKRDGVVVCTGEQLSGATFLVRSHARATMSFTIASVRALRFGASLFEGYRIETGGASACEPSVAERVRRQLGLETSTTRTPRDPAPIPAGYEFGRDDDLVLAVDGPLYDAEGRTLRDSQAPWFNLACVGDALAKRTLHGLHVANADSLNETSLRMLTANYCGKPYTVRGMKVEFLRELLPGRREARWIDGKAACLDTPRLMNLQVEDGVPYPPSDLPAQLQPRGCEDRTCDEQRWTTALLAECQLQRCRPEGKFDIESYTHDGDPNRVLFKR